MKEIDKTKENIGVSDLDDKTKKDLFNKFVGAGGQVIENKKKKGLTDFDRDKQKQYKQKIETHKKKIQNVKPVVQQRKTSAKSPKAKSSPAVKGEPGSLGLFFQKWNIRFKLMLAGVTDFYGYYITTKFMAKWEHEYKTALLESQMIYLDLFRQNPAVGKEIIDQLDSLKFIYFELIEKLGSIYDRSIFNRISDYYNNFPDVPQKVYDLREPLMATFKNLYLLNGYTDLLAYAFEKAVDIQMKVEKNKASIYSSKKKKMRNNIYIIFHKLFPRLHLLFCNFEGRFYPLSDPEIDRILQITEEERPGKRKSSTEPREDITIKTQTEMDGEAETDEAGEQKDNRSDEVRRGMELMYSLNLKKMREQFDRTGIFQHVRDNDKVLMTYLYFLEFDKEYSLILTTHKIKYKVDYSASGKIDYRQKFSDLYNELRGCMGSLEEYANVLATYEKLRKEKPVSNTQYMEYSKRLTGLEKNRNHVGKTARMTIRAFMEKINQEFKTLIKDMDTTQNVVDNPQDVLVFDAGIEGEKKISGKKVFEAIDQAYCYTAAFIDRLAPGGDLSGDLEMKETETREQATPKPPVEEQPKSAPVNTKAPEKKPAEEKKPEKKSVIDELEDLF